MDIDDLIQNIHQFFITQYANGSGQSQTFLAFEPLGLMVSPDDFMHDGSFNPTLAGQQISMIADVVPSISDTFEQDAMNKISDQYGALTGDGNNLLGSIMFYDKNIDPDQMDEYAALFGNLKANAQQRFSQSAEQASVLNPSSQVAACNVNPGTWYDKDSPIWQKKSFQQSQSQPVNTPPNQTKFVWKLNPDVHLMTSNPHVQNIFLKHPALFNVKEMSIEPTAATSNVAAISSGSETKATATAEQPASSTRTNIMFHSAGSQQSIKAVNTGSIAESTRINHLDEGIKPTEPEPGTPVINRSNYMVLRKTIPFNQMVNLNRVIGLNNNVLSQPVNSTQFTIDFSYSLVNIERDWMYQPLFDKAGLWYALTMKAGDFSTGENAATNKGLLRCIPKAMIVVKDVTITASWSATDKQMASSSYGFGCFNISGSQPINSNNQLIAPGIQIIAWICEVLPKLPLNDDPGLSTGSADSGNTQGNDQKDSGNQNDSTAPASGSSDTGTGTPAVATPTP